MMQDERNAVCSLWLLAARQDEAMLAGIVAELADRHSTPTFHPHLTLLGDIEKPPAALVAAIPGIARATASFTLTIRDVVSGDAYFRSFYAVFDATSELRALRHAAEAHIGSGAQPFMPHVSLMYGRVPEPQKSASTAEVAHRLTGRAIRFDRLVVTNSADAVPVGDWRILQTAALGAP